AAASLRGSVVHRGPVSVSETGSPPRRTRLLDPLEPRVRAVAAADLRGGLAVGQDDVAGEVVRAADQRRADAVGVNRDALLLERADLVDVEAAGDDDPDLPEALAVERLAHLPDEPLV